MPPPWYTNDSSDYLFAGTTTYDTSPFSSQNSTNTQNADAFIQLDNSQILTAIYEAKHTLGWSEIDLTYGIPRRIMDYPNAQAFFYEKAMSIATDDEVRAAYNEDGLAGVRQLVLEYASEHGIGSSYGRSVDYTPRFNDVAEEWPHRACAFLARYEYLNQDRPDEGYVEDIKKFAQAEALLDENGDPIEDGHPEEVGETWVDDPFESDELTDEEAETVLACRNYLLDDPPREMLDDVDDHDSFREWLLDEGDLQVAFARHAYDSSLPEDLLDQLADPSEWERLDPADVESAQCSYCGTEMFHVYTSEYNSPRWLDAGNGHATEVYDLQELTGFAWSLNPANDTLCDACYSDLRESATITMVVPVSGGSVVALLKRDQFLFDYSNTVPSAESMEAVSGSHMESFLRYVVDEGPTNSSDGETIIVRPSESPDGSDAEEQRDYLRAIVDGEITPDFDNAIVYRHENYSGNSYGAVMENDPETCVEVKGVLESPPVETADESEQEELGELFG